VTVYGLPKGFDGSRLAGRLLQQICFGLYQVQLRFDGKLTIAVESTFLYKDSSASDPKRIGIPDLPGVQSDLLRLLHHKIVSAFGDVGGTLTLEFDDGLVLQCLDRPHYEAYQIMLGDEEIVV
jgi:hypothetical protein